MTNRQIQFAYEDAAQDVQSIIWAIDEARDYADHEEVKRLTACAKAAMAKRDALRTAYLRSIGCRIA